MFRIYDLRLSTQASLTRAVARILDSEEVASCAVEPELRRVRFIARRRSADALVSGIYAEGGLTWCSRHDWRPVGREEAGWRSSSGSRRAQRRACGIGSASA